MRINVGGYYLETLNYWCNRYHICPEWALEALIEFWDDNADPYDKIAYFDDIKKGHENNGKEDL